MQLNIYVAVYALWYFSVVLFDVGVQMLYIITLKNDPAVKRYMKQVILTPKIRSLSYCFWKTAIPRGNTN